MSHGGKGSAVRPSEVSKQTFNNTWETIFGKKAAAARPAPTYDIGSTESIRCEFDGPSQSAFNANPKLGEQLSELRNKAAKQTLEEIALVDHVFALEKLLAEAAQLFRKYEESHRKRGPEHLDKAKTNAEIAGRIEALLAMPV